MKLYSKKACARILSQNGRWKGGRYTRHDGYIYVKSPEHPDSDCRGYIAEHRLVAEKIVGRRLTKQETVHHKNGNTSDNRKVNLEVLNRATHQSKHSKGKGNARYRHDINDGLIKRLRAKGLSYRAIVQKTGYPQTTIARRIRSWSL